MKKIQDILFSYKMTLILFLLLAIGAGVATFIENDFGTTTAKVLVYNSNWYALLLLLININLAGIIYRRKMWKKKGRFIFHISFIIMLIGAILTRYIGYEGTMHIREGETSNKVLTTEAYLQIKIKDKLYDYNMRFSALGDNYFEKTININGKRLIIEYKNYKFVKKGKSHMGLLTLRLSYNNKEKEIRIPALEGMGAMFKDIKIGNLDIKIGYGSKYFYLPFKIKLIDFELKRYPGSMAPSSYSSDVVVIDKDKKFDYKIYMNHTLSYGGYKFFQSSYDMDELGTILSVNHDPGKIPTYIGYALLIIGLLINFFDKTSRFRKLFNIINNKTILSIAVLLFANNLYSSVIDDLKEYKQNSKEVAKVFGELVVQHRGRMMPLDTLNKEIVNKLTGGKSSFMGMDYNQIVLGIFTQPTLWKDVRLIRIKTPKLKKFLKIDKNRKYISFSEVLNNQGYILANEVEKANRIADSKRGTYERNLISVDERINIFYMVFSGSLFKIFPKVNDKSKNWYDIATAIKSFEGKNREVVRAMIVAIVTSIDKKDYKNAKAMMENIKLYQKAVGKDLMPNSNVIKAEILWNKIDIFPKLTIIYVLLGIGLFIFSFIVVFKNINQDKIYKVVLNSLIILFIIQTLSMGLRWYISGHAPWSNTYESLVYISWSMMFAGVVFFRQSLIALSGTILMAGIFLFVAHLNGINPQITNLVPVLKSYWLTIHVSIMTGSYGFLGLGAILSFVVLILFNFRNEHIDKQIKYITAVVEANLIIGLAMLVVGNFIGGVWANESWGRYWGWDPKETWAWVTILVYSIVVHSRFVKPLNDIYIFNVLSLISFSSVLMTYFGVNFYLSGMHSYATGDPVPIPTWVYVVTAIVFIIIALAYRKKDFGKLV